MADMQVEFLGGDRAGQVISPISEEELAKLGYRKAIETNANGAELLICVAVPVTWNENEAHRAIMAKFGANKDGRAGKRSL